MSLSNSNNSLSDFKKKRNLKKLVGIFHSKLINIQEHFFERFYFICILRSKKYQQLQVQEFSRKVNRIFQNKQRLYFNVFVSSMKLLGISKIQQQISNIKTKDRIFQAKVKSLRVLSKQQKQKKVTTQYKNKYFGPKIQSNKNNKSSQTKDIYISLSDILKKKYFSAFNLIKSTQIMKIRNSKVIYLVNYLQHKKRYWLTYGIQKLKLNILVNRQAKNHQQIAELDKKLAPLQDPQIISIRQKQQKIQSALDNVFKDKSSSQFQIDKQFAELNGKFQILNKELKQLRQKQTNLKNQLEQCVFKMNNHQFSKQQIYYIIFINFLTNVKLWQEFQTKENNQFEVNKAMLLDWLRTPKLDFHLDTIYFSPQDLQSYIKSLEQLQLYYKRTKGQNEYIQASIDFILQTNFSNKGISLVSNSLEQFLMKNKISHKILVSVLQQNKQIIFIMIRQMRNQYQRLLNDIQQNELQ